MESAVEYLHSIYAGIRTGRASPSLLDGLKVEYHGSQLPVNQLATVIASDSKTIAIRAFDPGAVANIEKAIFQSKLGLTPQKAGVVIHLTIPPISEERRRQLILQAKDAAETQRVAVRNIRRESMKSAEDLALPEDENKELKSRIDAITKGYVEQIDEALKRKTDSLLDIANKWVPGC